MRCSCSTRQIFANVGTESGTIRFTSLKDKFEPALALLADMMLNSTNPDSALERNRARMLVSLTQAKDQPNTIASNVFSKVTYGDEHPYGRVVTEQTVKAIKRDDVVAFAEGVLQAGPSGDHRVGGHRCKGRARRSRTRACELAGWR